MYGCLHYRAELCVRTALRGRYYVYPLQHLPATAIKRRYYYYYYTSSVRAFICITQNLGPSECKAERDIGILHSANEILILGLGTQILSKLTKSYKACMVTW